MPFQAVEPYREEGEVSTDMDKITTSLAIEAFAKVEQKEYQLDMAKHALAKALRHGNLDLEYYYAETEKVREKYEKDREFAARLGKLPRESS
jgi:hypothetical protein